jgi:transposase
MQFKDWWDKSAQQIHPKTVLGKALAYSLNQWPKLIRHIENGNLSIDNNRAECAIKPFVIGQNWLFSNTAKANGLVPFDYLNYLLNEIPNLKLDDIIDHLLLWNCAKY